VIANRTQYREKFARVTPMLAEVLDVALPDAGFYLWAGVDGSDTDFARALYALYNVTVLPGSFLAREARPQPGRRPHPHGTGGRNRRMRGSRAAHRRLRPVPNLKALPDFLPSPACP
jgi:hypothetical protein